MLAATVASDLSSPRNAKPTPFRSAEEAWLWTMSALVVGRGGTLSRGSAPSRPCRPEDVLKCLDQLYRRRRIDLLHARILRIWGERQSSPHPARDRCDWRIWREALDRLEWKLRASGIVVP